MKIIAGAWRGRSLAVPAGETTRPTSARAREALFSTLQSRLGSFDGLRVADLFAGTGALGLEALSRGAAHCTFVERDRAALSALRANVAKVGAEARAQVIARTAPAIGFIETPVKLAFLDAPYGRGLTAATLGALRERAWLEPDALVAAEVAADETLEAPGYELMKERRYGPALILLLCAR